CLWSLPARVDTTDPLSDFSLSIDKCTSKKLWIGNSEAIKEHAHAGISRSRLVHLAVARAEILPPLSGKTREHIHKEKGCRERSQAALFKRAQLSSFHPFLKDRHNRDDKSIAKLLIQLLACL